MEKQKDTETTMAGGDKTSSIIKASCNAAPEQSKELAGGSDPAQTSNAAKTKKQDKVLCFRCDLPGHEATECAAILCVYCDSASIRG